MRSTLFTSRKKNIPDGGRRAKGEKNMNPFLCRVRAYALLAFFFSTLSVGIASPSSVGRLSPAEIYLDLALLKVGRIPADIRSLLILPFPGYPARNTGSGNRASGTGSALDADFRCYRCSHQRFWGCEKKSCFPDGRIDQPGKFRRTSAGPAGKSCRDQYRNGTESA